MARSSRSSCRRWQIATTSTFRSLMRQADSRWRFSRMTTLLIWSSRLSKLKVAVRSFQHLASLQRTRVKQRSSRVWKFRTSRRRLQALRPFSSRKLFWNWSLHRRSHRITTSSWTFALAKITWARSSLQVVWAEQYRVSILALSKLRFLLLTAKRWFWVASTRLSVARPSKRYRFLAISRLPAYCFAASSEWITKPSC